jgi:hypothetical protein
MHITEEYNERSCFGPLDDRGYPYCHFTDQEAILAPLCAPHKLCICIPKEDRWAGEVRLHPNSRAHIGTLIEKALRKGVQSMLGNRIPQHTINATAITYHNAHMRYVVPPQSGQVSCEYMLSCIHPGTSLSDGQDLNSTTSAQRARQIAEFIMVVYGPDRPFPSPGRIVIVRPQSMILGKNLKELKQRVQIILEETSAEWPEAARSILLDRVSRVQYWLAKAGYKDLEHCKVCGGEYWRAQNVETVTHVLHLEMI